MRRVAAGVDSKFVTEEERLRLSRAGFGQRIGYGSRPAVIVIDVQNYTVGLKEGPDPSYPSAGGRAAHEAVARLVRILKAARQKHVPVVYTRFALSRDGSDAGVYGLKRKLLDIDGWCIEGTKGAEIYDEVAPESGDMVLTKKRPSAFLGTFLNSLLIERKVDTLILTGGTTSNCVRATAVDGMSYNYRVMVVEDCVFDRVQVSHEVALFDLDRQYADVVNSDSVLSYLSGLP